MNDDFSYGFTQISDLEFKYDLAVSDIDIIGDWAEETFCDDDYHFYDTRFGTRAYTVYIRFNNIESAAAFKLRWLN